MIAEIFIARSRYWLTKEYPIKIRRCVEAVPDSAIWARSDEGSNSIGNLLVHLAGNVTEWIVGGVGGKAYERHRAAEFEQTEGQDGTSLVDNLERVLRDADSVLAGLVEADLERSIVIQNRDTTVIGAIYHVVEHFAMHTGQIVLLAKAHAPGKIRFYEDAGGLAHPIWHRGTALDEAPH
jgi:uncharacterized damage-inducible protein DinB